MGNKVWLTAGCIVAILVVAILVHLFVDKDTSNLLSTDKHTYATTTDKKEVDKDGDVSASSTFQKVITPIPLQPVIDKKKAKIGWLLFKDPNLSSNNQVSCESCHHLTTNGAEPTVTSLGVGGQGTRNSLTVFNVAYNYRFFWDGRANSLADQLDGPVHNVLEMDSNWDKITQYISSTQSYTYLFAATGLEINENNVKAVLIEFMNGLTTPNSQFDQYLLGIGIYTSFVSSLCPYGFFAYILTN